MTFREVDWELVDLFESGEFEFPVWEHGVARQIVRALLKKRVYHSDIADATGTDPSDFEAWLNQSGKVMVGEWVIHWINDKEENVKRMQRKATRGKSGRRRKQNHNHRVKTQAAKRTQPDPQPANNEPTVDNNVGESDANENNNAIKLQDLCDPTKPYMSLPNQRLVPSAPEMPPNVRYETTNHPRSNGRDHRGRRNLLNDIEEELKRRQQGAIVPSAPVANRNDYELMPTRTTQRVDTPDGSKDSMDSTTETMVPDVPETAISNAEVKQTTAESKRQKFRKSKTSSKDLSTSDRSGTESPKPDKTSRFLGWRIRLGKKRSSAPSIIEVSSALTSKSPTSKSPPSSAPVSPVPCSPSVSPPPLVPSAPIMREYVSDETSIPEEPKPRIRRKPIKPLGPPPTPPRMHCSVRSSAVTFPTDDIKLPKLPSTSKGNIPTPSTPRYLRSNNEKNIYNSIRHGVINPGYVNNELKQRQPSNKTSQNPEPNVCDCARPTKITNSTDYKYKNQDVKLPYPVKSSPTMHFKHKHCKCGKTRRPPPPLPPDGSKSKEPSDNVQNPTQPTSDVPTNAVKCSVRQNEGSSLFDDITPKICSNDDSNNLKGKQSIVGRSPAIAIQEDAEVITVSDRKIGLALHAYNTRNYHKVEPATLNRVVEKTKNRKVIMHDAIIHNYVNESADNSDHRTEIPPLLPEIHENHCDFEGDNLRNIPKQNLLLHENEDKIQEQDVQNNPPDYVNENPTENPQVLLQTRICKQKTGNKYGSQESNQIKSQSKSDKLDRGVKSKIPTKPKNEGSVKFHIPDCDLQLPRKIKEGSKSINNTKIDPEKHNKQNLTDQNSQDQHNDYYNNNDAVAGEYVDLVEEPDSTGGPGYLYMLTDKRHEANPTPTSYRFKIGSSRNPQEVLDTYKQKQPDIDMIWKVKVRSHMTAVYHVRENLKRHWIRGDWFTCPLPVLMEEVSKIAKQYKL